MNTTDTREGANYVQSEWYCYKCGVNHIGNCPKIKVTMTTSSTTDTRLEPMNQDVSQTKDSDIKNKTCITDDIPNQELERQDQ